MQKYIQLIVGAIVGVSCLTQTATLTGQLRDRSLPSQRYYTAFLDFYNADYNDALKQFIRGANTAFKLGPDERFLDSACYWTMAGECHYHMGNYAEALAYYEQSLELLMYYTEGGWQQRIQTPAVQASTSAVQRARITWYQSSRGSAYAKVPGSFSMMFGRLDAARAFVEGGVVDSAELRAVDHAEIMRCAALAIYRRNVIKGITNRIDPLTSRLARRLNSLPAETPVMGKWNLMVIGLANMSAGKNTRAAAQINSALRLAGGMDHHLTPIGLLALSQIALAEGETAVASTLALEASYAAGIYRQFDMVEEALRFGTAIHLASSNSVYPPLPAAIAWAAQNKARMMQASLIIRLADCFVEAENVTEAAQTLAQTKRAMSGTDLGRSSLAGQARYIGAAIEFMRSGDGLKDLQRALPELQRTSRWLFQLGSLNNALVAGGVTQRQAELIYEQLLTDPTELDWKFRPMDTLAYLSTDHVSSMEQWFEILLARKNHEKAIEVAEMVRRHRFYATLPMAGRMLALRWVMSAPEDVLDAKALEQRKNFYRRYPTFRDSVDRLAEIQRQLRTLPLKPDDDSPEQKLQQRLFVEQRDLALAQEAALASVALRRQPAEFVFPAASQYSDLGKRLSSKQVIVSSLQTGSGYHQYVQTQQTRRYLGVVRERDMRRGLAKLYKSMGIADANGPIDANILNSTEWKSVAAEIKDLLFENYHDDQWENYDELIVVPDGVLWYLPFEVLQTGSDESEWENLLESVKIRYVPMIALAAGSKRPVGPDARMAVVTGRLHAKTEEDLVQRGLEKLTDQLTTAVEFSGQVKIPSNLLRSVIDTLVVWVDTRVESRDGPYALMPFQLDKGRRGNTLASWMAGPWQGPEKMVLSGFSSAGAGGIKSRADGQDLFLTTTGLLAAGVRSVLISRWRVGGENSLELAREFALKSRDASTPLALYESIAFAREQDVNLINEIRVRASKKQPDPFKAHHPFFWAGNLLVDLEGYVEGQDQAGGDADDGATNDSDDTEDSEDADDDDPKPDDAPSQQGSDTKTNPGSGSKETESEEEEGEAGEKGSGNSNPLPGSGNRNQGSGLRNPLG